ncbi:MAG: hypothetical protein QOD32_384 [Pyrinomonadaceae bacterium]|jgi:hypothetical protein|nr:hypothetical protein [Pyrinomonadaceae bacterium]
MRELNWEIILSNLAEAREQLEQIEQRMKAGEPPVEGEFQVMLEHAYHHLNIAWNARRISSKKYSRMTDEAFNQWGKFPKELEEWKTTGS